MEIKCIVEDEEYLPVRAKVGDAGADLKLKEDVFLLPNRKMRVGTGVKVEIPPGYVGLVVPRSSSGKLDIRLANTVGVIDSGYRGEIMVFLKYTGDDIYEGEAGDRIAQLIIVPFVCATYTAVSELSDTDRGDGGFGHTGQ